MEQTTTDFISGNKLPLILRLKLWNRYRLKKNRIKRLLKQDPTDRSYVPHPETVSKLLFIEAQKGWGDFLYFLGLLNELHNYGVIIDVASLPTTYSRYKNIDFIRTVFSMSNENDIIEISKRSYDVAIDITYVNDNGWEFRKPLLSMLTCHTMTTSDIASLSRLFDEFIDISSKAHWQKRNALILNKILNPHVEIENIPPFYPVPQTSLVADHFLSMFNKNKDLVYVNTVGGDKYRTLCQKQVEAIASIFNEKKQSIGIFFSNFPIKETDHVKRLSQMQFDDLTKVVQQCKAIISPDTSIVHLGSALKIPVLGFYCGNNRDYWPKHAMQDVWAPLAENSFIYVEDDPGVNTLADYIYTHRKKPISSYDPLVLKQTCIDFLNKLCL